MKYFVILAITQLSVLFSIAQVPKKIIVEHFTNTRCGICANRNPGFFNNLDSQNGVLHMAVHPSSPYSSCILNQHNSSENDDRTEYYGIYGSTPRLVIQGEVVSASANYGNASIFNPYLDDSSAFSVHLVPSITSNEDSLYVDAYIVRESISTTNEGVLFIAAIEGLIEYNAPNGEDEHHNVFRRSYLDVSGESVSLPSNVGDSVKISSGLAIDEEWVLSEMYALAILQDDSKAVLQSESSEGTALDTIQSSGEALGQNVIAESQVNVYPNPASTVVNIQATVGISAAEVFDLLGQRVISVTNEAETSAINIASLPSGKYVLRTTDSDGHVTAFPLIKY